MSKKHDKPGFYGYSVNDVIGLYKFCKETEITPEQAETALEALEDNENVKELMTDALFIHIEETI